MMNGVNTMKIRKGSYGYIERNKKVSLIKSIGGLSIILVIFILGLIITKTRLNWFTFVSVLCALPVGKMIVAFIVAWPHKSISRKEYEKIKEKEEGIQIIYDLVITSYEKVMQIDSVAIIGSTLCAYSTDKKLVEQTATDYIKNMLTNNGCHASIKIYKDLDSYLSRIDEMKSNLNTQASREVEKDKNKEMKAVETLLAISI